MASVASQLIEEDIAHAQSDSLEDTQEICTDGTYLLNNLCIIHSVTVLTYWSISISRLYGNPTSIMLILKIITLNRKDVKGIICI